MLCCDVCKTDAIAWVHDGGALCSVCKTQIEAGRYSSHPELPQGLQACVTGSFELVPVIGGGSRLAWVPVQQ